MNIEEFLIFMQSLGALHSFTFGMIKPDAVAAGRTEAIIKRIQDNGFTVMASNPLKLDREDAEWLYGEHEGKAFFQDLINFTLSGHVVLMLIIGDGQNFPEEFRKLLGATKPAEAEPGTIRAEFGLKGEEFTGQQNAVHGAASTARAIVEGHHFLNKYIKEFNLPC